MKRLSLAVAALAALATPALAYVDPVTGFADNAVIVDFGNAQAYVPQKTSVISGQYTLAITSVTSLTVPTTATVADICATAGVARYTLDGTTPTATAGLQIASGACVTIPANAALVAAKFIGSAVTIDVTYWK